MTVSFPCILACLAFVASLSCSAAQAGAQPVFPDGRVPSLAPLIEDVTPAVVNIAVMSASPEEDNPLMQDPFFRRFFGLPDRPEPQLSAGSGVIVDAANGYVLTNHHVIKGAREVMVTLKDRRQLQAQVVGSDAGTDIAVLRIQSGRLKALPFGDSESLRVGDYALAIGNPFGLGQTVTSGIISALGRSGLNIEGYEDFIQTDAAINPGNSGGALVNLKGELIGINTAIIGPSGGNVGIGFAVPSNMARSVMTQIIRYGEVRRGRFGASSQDVTPELAQAMGLATSDGVVIVEVADESPAERAGLRRGDVVTHINGRRVRSSADLRNQVGLTPIGEELEMRILRGREVRTLRAKIEAVHAGGERGGQAVPELAGAAVADYERNGRSQAVAVVRVERNSPAWGHGLRDGDIIAGVNRRRVRSVEELLAALKNTQRPLYLQIVRGDARFAIQIR
jgi:Do/DeqQ family serine protease